MGRIVKIGLVSVEYQRSLLVHNIPIYFKNNVMKKTKVR